MRITIRLTELEEKMLREISESEVRGDLNTSSMIRLMIHREFNRRKGLPSPKPAHYQTEHRTGRPTRNWQTYSFTTSENSQST